MTPQDRKSAKKPANTPARRRGRFIPAGQFKATCLAVMQQVQETGTPVTITKRGAPLVRVVPASDPAAPPLFGRLKGTVQIAGDITAPIDTEWDVLADD